MNAAPALYVHIPFCETKCPYCDFNSFALADRDVDGYLDALRLEMDRRGVPRDPPTVYVGGGTPTVLAPAQLERFLDDLCRRLEPEPRREFTVEANPGSFTPEKARILAAHGVNRISIGAQSFSDRTLEALGRVHRARDVPEAVEAARRAGIEAVNLDLIHSVPGMTLRDWAETLEQALALGPAHLSCYALIFEPGTAFHARLRAGSLRPVPEEAELAMFRFTERRLRRAGYVRYEISNFARPGQECRHNLIYWRNESYVGFGAGAWSYEGGLRRGNARSLARYVESVRACGEAFAESERLEPEAAARETVALALRTAAGVDLGAVARRFGLEGVLEAECEPVIRRLERCRLVRRDPSGRIRLRRRGWRLADLVQAEFLDPDPALFPHP